jgi:hypothetical protein
MANENPQQQIQIQDPIPGGGEYSNWAHIAHNKEEFRMTFGNVMAPAGRVTAKLVTTPSHFKSIVNAMMENLKMYEKAFGAIAESKPVEGEIGFKSKD